MLIQLLFALNTLISGMSGARILGVFPYPSYSYQIHCQKIWKDLSLRGHDVTVITTNPLKDPTIPNLTEIDLHFTSKPLTQFWNEISEKQISELQLLSKVYDIIDVIIEQQLQYEPVQKLIQNQTEHFDVILVHVIFPVTYGFSARFKCPIIGIIPVELPDLFHYLIGNPVHPVLNPAHLISRSSGLNFWERIKSVLTSISVLVYGWYKLFPKSDQLIRKYIEPNSPPSIEMARNISLFISTVNLFLTNPRPNLPFIIEVSGLHIDSVVKPLPKNIAEFLDSASEGVIYVSFGTKLNSSILPVNFLRVLFETFEELPYKVLWKYENQTLPHLSQKIKIFKWLPQQDILAHSNIKAFLMQGGYQSLEEAIIRQVPIIGVPFHMDQYKNVQKILEHEIGLSIDKEIVTKETLKWTLQEVINNQKYRKNMKNIANKLVDEPMKPLEKVVWWIEYVIRHNGTKHLQNRERIEIPLYKYLFLDILISLLLTIIIIIFIMIKLFKFIFSSFGNKKQKTH